MGSGGSWSGVDHVAHGLGMGQVAHGLSGGGDQMAHAPPPQEE